MLIEKIGGFTLFRVLIHRHGIGEIMILFDGKEFVNADLFGYGKDYYHEVILDEEALERFHPGLLAQARAMIA